MSDGETAFCINCGEEIPAQADICPDCGAEQTLNATSESSGDESTGSDEGNSGTSVMKYGRHVSYIWGGLLLLIAIGAVTDGSTRGLISGVAALGLGLLFFPITRQKVGIGNLPGIEAGNTNRRNVLTGIGYGFGSMIVLGALLPETESNTTATSQSNSDSSGGSDDGSTKGEYADAWAYDEDTGIALRNVQGSTDQFSTTISGEAINNGEDYEYVQLTFDLYDESGSKVGDALDNTNGLEEGQTWRFEAMGMDSSASSFELNDITAY